MEAPFCSAFPTKLPHLEHASDLGRVHNLYLRHRGDDASSPTLKDRAWRESCGRGRSPCYHVVLLVGFSCLLVVLDKLGQVLRPHRRRRSQTRLSCSDMEWSGTPSFRFRRSMRLFGEQVGRWLVSVRESLGLSTHRRSSGLLSEAIRDGGQT